MTFEVTDVETKGEMGRHFVKIVAINTKKKMKVNRLILLAILNYLVAMDIQTQWVAIGANIIVILSLILALLLWATE